MQRQKTVSLLLFLLQDSKKPSAHIEALNKQTVTYHINKGILFLVIGISAVCVNSIVVHFSMHVLSDGGSDGLCILKAKFFKFVVIVSILSHPCSFSVYYYLFDVFLPRHTIIFRFHSV